MIIRHGERPGAVQPPFGVNAAGNHESGSLAVLGWQRAGALVELFHPASGTFRPGLVRPTALFAPIPTSVSQRPLETITPTSQRIGIPVRTPVAYTADAQIAKILANTSGSPLAAWEHGNIPLIALALGNVHPKPPTAWPGDRFDVVWVFTRRNGGGWNFKQIPQLLLHGDKDSVKRRTGCG